MVLKWIIVDAMGVIFREGRDLYELLIPFALEKNPKLSESVILRTYLKGSLGLISSQELWNILGLGNHYPEIEKEYLDNYLSIDEDFYQFIEKVYSNYSIAMLSNDLKEWSNYLRNKYDLNKYFREIIISGEVNLRKPDIEIFELLLERLKVPAQACIFIDDNLKNVNNASKLGINTIRFVRSKEKVAFCSEFEVSSFKELYSVLKNFY
ncbi:MAG: HAD-IA family hydrolase [Candidatus Lokiarchaeota archaeon]|nr:HAD-IA family hydrolase [Candidatus Lokiarchaeota archaeon]MBD3340487.1 HAD-IA family hydrolase [Candidatus Lokiarchaeota archaeon]